MQIMLFVSVCEVVFVCVFVCVYVFVMVCMSFCLFGCVWCLRVYFVWCFGFV